MSPKYMHKPGWMSRAIFAWLFFSLFALAFIGGILWVLNWIGISLEVWYVVIPTLIAFVIAELYIMSETISPIFREIKDWIFQSEYVDEEKGEKPSWKK